MEQDDFTPVDPNDWIEKAKAVAYRQFPLDEPKPATSALQAFDVASVKGIPVLGPLATKGDAAVDALVDLAKGTVNGPQSVSAAPATGVLDFLKNQYGAHLKEREGKQALLEQEHPAATAAGKVTGQIAGYAALPASTMATLPAAIATNAGINAADTAVRGGSGGEVLGSAAGGAVGGAAGYGAGKVLANTLGKLADWQAARAMGGTTGTAYRDIANASRNLNLEPGGLAELGRAQKIVGGVRKLEDVAEGAGAAREAVGEQFANLVSKADDTGSLIKLDDALAAIGGAAKKGVRPKYMEAAIKEAKDELAEVAGPAGLLTHGQLQEWLATRADQASGIANSLAKKENVSAADRAFNAVYRSGRDLQDRLLSGALPANAGEAKELRRVLALNHVTERISQNRAQMLSGQHPIGLIGSMGALGGLQQITSGNLATGVPLLAASLLGKATAPYRANVLTSVFSRGQNVAESALPAILGSKLGSAIGEYKGKPAEEDDFEPIPVQEPTPPVAGRVLLRSVKGN